MTHYPTQSQAARRSCCRLSQPADQATDIRRARASSHPCELAAPGDQLSYKAAEPASLHPLRACGL
ncbi:UNVERIFIED_CONTAM: hypothetical protein Slati_2503900 [Sesamum latifolium]|uniref:Uncharacterized protein n=1 Tax=Sesamum latifolium TaxID=2727402 RepID=A0AAW2WEP7_9LAMI